MAHFDDQGFHEDDPESSFESFLKEKDKWIAPQPTEIARQHTVEIPISTEEIPSNPAPSAGVEESSDGQSESGATDTSSSTSAPSVVEKSTRTEIRTHPIIGTYTVEYDVEIPIDEEWKRIYIETQKIAVTELQGTPMEKLTAIVERINKRSRDIVLINAEIHGLSWAKNQFLQYLNEAERAHIRELDKKYKVKPSTSRKSKDASKKSTSSKGKTGPMRAVDTFKSLMMSKEATIKQMDAEGKLDADLRAYIEKVYEK